MDAVKVFGSFAGEERLFGGSEERAKAYFSHLLPESEIAPGEGVMLVFAAITLGVLDRPLLAHRCSRQEIELMGAAQAADPEKFHLVGARMGAEAPRPLRCRHTHQEGVPTARFGSHGRGDR